jgi:hypothetical protein
MATQAAAPTSRGGTPLRVVQHRRRRHIPNAARMLETSGLCDVVQAQFWGRHVQHQERARNGEHACANKRASHSDA